ncbi:hypothetical protein BaRGS_00025256 [Batillaria attramentaria]|uniref:Ribosomal protein eL8/eL30/eS12/Gadd45 domain-containing protein n=1 Tax=Batillaria attramentaria TaxID=370345 RepID=A0ABD0K8P3_9CAEN
MAASSAKFMKEKRKRRFSGPGYALRASLRQAAAQRRLTVGLNRCVNMLKRNPEKVMVCLLLRSAPSASGDQAVSNIQHTLLKAFCTENHISIVHVCGDMSLMRLVGRLAGRTVDDGQELCSDSLEDCSLILIEHPSGAPSSEDLTWAAACHGGHLDIQASGHMPSD